MRGSQPVKACLRLSTSWSRGPTRILISLVGWNESDVVDQLLRSRARRGKCLPLAEQHLPAVVGQCRYPLMGQQHSVGGLIRKHRHREEAKDIAPSSEGVDAVRSNDNFGLSGGALAD